MHNQTAQPPADAGHASEAAGQRPGHSPAAQPVFLDPSGRRQRRVRRLGRLLAIPAAGYVALLLSTALGGPSVDSPYLPLPAAGDHHTGGTTTGHQAPSTAGSGSAGRKKGASPGSRTAQPTTSGGTAGVSPHPAAPATAPASSAASPSASASAGPSATPVPTATHGKSTATHPVPTHTARGHG